MKPYTGGTNHTPKPPLVPTSAAPGSKEKLAELEARAELGLGLWHEEDAQVRVSDYFCFSGED